MNIYRFVRIFAAAILCAGTTWADAIPQVVDLPSQLSLGARSPSCEISAPTS